MERIKTWWNNTIDVIAILVIVVKFLTSPEEEQRKPMQGFKTQEINLREHYSARGRIRRLAINTRLHVVLGLCMVIFAVGVGINPRFPFQGDLYELSPLLVDAYVVWFAAFGLLMIFRRPKGVEWIIFCTPILFHSISTIFDVLFNTIQTRLPVVAVYLFIITSVLKLTLIEALE